MKVRINARGREVEIECGDSNVTYREVADKALEVWVGTCVTAAGSGPSVGFMANSERTVDE